jgi:hypothetical protein
MLKYKCTYFEVDHNQGSKNFGLLVKRTKQFPFFNEAVDFARRVSNTSINVVGRPLIEEVSRQGRKD